jgi:Nif-specific regulatory protein
VDSLQAELERVQRERDLYRNLLLLGEQTQIEPFLRQSLALIVEATSAHQGYIELREPRSEDGEIWSTSHACTSEQVEGIRSLISQGIIAEALATGETVVTASAVADERFASRGSVRLSKIQAVLCVPIGRDPCFGVVYLAGRRDPSVFNDSDRTRAEMLARHIGPFADRVLVRQRERTDATRDLRKELKLEGLVGRSAALAAAFRQLALACPLDINVLITGDTGTGKTDVARAIHANSPRQNGPFVDLNCAALPETLIESELFGARAGAHSMAARPIAGKVAAAECGTLFLDEISELPQAAQAKILQLVQSKTYWPLGATQPVRADVRVIAATNSDLKHAVSEHRFREDLYYRLAVLEIRMPSLRERREDIELLAQHACRFACERHHLHALELSQGALRALQNAEWPGNVRQLLHAIEAAAIRAHSERASFIEQRHIFPGRPASDDGDDAVLTFQEATRRFQCGLIRTTLRETQGNVAEAARRLDLARSHLYTLIKTCELDVDR